ncbi:PorT family protein [Parabacteroides sp. OttesenSCG-928-G07]|nr:PorT family protein [Parabacteroides sp. OttesenSCG-928-G07]
MKRVVSVLIVALVALIAIPAQAQLRFGVKGGVNISTISFSKDIIDADNTTGFHLGPMIEANIPLLGMGFDLALLYSQKGMGVGDNSYHTDYIDIPLNLKWKFGLPIIKGYLAAGPYASFRVGGEKKWDHLMNQFKAKSFGAGLNFGAGVEIISHLQVGLNYELGLTNNFSAKPITSSSVEEKTGKNRGWSITAAILF